MQAESDISIQCPYCWESFFVRVDYTAGNQQRFSYDCEICCRPIDIQIHLDSQGNASTNTQREIT